jgi:hypothetical protein
LQFVNIGEVRNWGDELAVDARVVERPAFALNFGITLSHNQNLVEKMNSPLAFSIAPGQWIARGFPVGSYFGLRLLSAGLDNTGRPINVMCDGGPANDHQPVPCATAPEIYLGQPLPRWEGALRGTMTILGNLTLYALADFKQGHMQDDGNASSALQSTSPSARLAVLGNDPLLQACNIAIPAANFVTAPNLCRAQRKAGFARLREASLSYTLPQEWTRGLRIASAALTLSGRNLADLWIEQGEIFGMKLLDPETRQGDETGELSNFVRSAIPQRTQILTTLRVTF